MAYGRNHMSLETRETFLHRQLQEGLRNDLMKSPAVSGSQTYKELCRAANNEEKRQLELRIGSSTTDSPATWQPVLNQARQIRTKQINLPNSSSDNSSQLLTQQVTGQRPAITVGRQDTLPVIARLQGLRARGTILQQEPKELTPERCRVSSKPTTHQTHLIRTSC